MQTVLSQSVGPDLDPDCLKTIHLKIWSAKVVCCIILLTLFDYCKYSGNLNSVDPGQTDKMSGLIWVHTVWHPDGIAERFFLKSWFWEIRRQQKNMKRFPVGKELTLLSYLGLSADNSLDSDRSDGISERIFLKKLILKKLSRQQKSMKNYPAACNELMR